ncbi:4566_t:CDS:1, partial [Gigaspora rosea]
GCTQKLRSHPYFKETHEMVIQIATDVRNHTITIRLFQKIFNCFINNEKFLVDYMNSAVENCPEYVIIEVLEKNRNQCNEYDLTLVRLQTFYDRFCSSQLVSDVQLYFNDLEKRSINTTIKESYTEEHWSMHSMTIEIMKDHYHLVSSQTFYNVFQSLLKQNLTVERVIKEIIKEAIKNYKTICEAYDRWEEIKCTVACEFWKN